MSPRPARLHCAAVMTWLALHPWTATAQSLTPPFTKCVATQAEWSYNELLCIYQVGAQQRRLEEARRHLRSLGAGRATHPWATLVLAHATLNDDEPQAMRHYQAAADAFRRMREAEGEVIARQNLRFLYHRRGASHEAARQVALAKEAAEASPTPLAIARASVLEAAHLLESGGDIGRAHRALLLAERSVFPAGPIALRRTVLFQLAAANMSLGRLDDAIDALERHRALRAEDGATTDAAAVAFNLLNAHLTQAEARPSADARARLVEMAQQVLAEIEGLNRPSAEAQAHRVLGDLVRPTDRERAAMHLRRCLEIEAPLGYPETRASCLWSLAMHEVSQDSLQAEQLSREAIRLASANTGSVLLAFAWQARLRLVWHTLPQAQAIAESFAALDAIERLRARQESNAARAALFHNWTRDYYWLTGRLLQVEPPQVDSAFEVGERLRVRVLLEHLALAGVTRDNDEDRNAGRQQLARRISDTQRRLLVPTLTAIERRALLDQLELLELERGESGDGDVPAADPGTLSFASLEAVQRALQPREAMLWFSLAAWKDLYDDFGGGAWVFVVTRDGVRLHRLATAVAFDSQVAALIGLLRQRETSDAAWMAAAQSLGRTLVADALADLPADVERLTIVSDGALHRLPFEILHVDDTTRTLGERFEVSVVPSATLWLRLRNIQSSISPGRPTLVLADPEVPRATGIGDFPLEPLPWARREAAAIARILRLDSAAVHQGSAASERALKDGRLGPYGVIHVAAHARADGSFPERSAVFLAPGGGDEDGWLQPREIAALNLAGSLVVLSACESADGALLSGEGPLSLARAFFAAGASVVVATRWPLRDDDVAFFMERFYSELGTGASVSRALHRARRDAMASGRPAALWAGVALLGDGSRLPIRPPVPPWHSTTRWRLALAATILLVGILAWRTARRVRRSSTDSNI